MDHLGIVIDSTYMYVAGWDNSPAIGKQWRIEKRNLSDGQLVSGFGTGGVVTSNPGTGVDDEAYGIAIDSTYMYVVGYDNASIDQQRRIEKRNLSNGALVTSFGTGGVVTTNSSTGSDGAFSIAIDSTYMYVAGYDNSPGNAQWRIEKRNLSDGQLAASFGTGGVVTTNPSGGSAVATGIAVDSTYMYVVGFDNSPGNGEWRIEKRTKGSAFGLADLQGTWNYHGLISGDSPAQTPGWYWGSFTADSTGTVTSASTITDSLGNSSYTPSIGAFNIFTSGIVTNPSAASYRGVMNKNKDMIVATATMAPGASTAVNGYNLQISLKSGGTFSPSDLTGTWNFHQLWSGDGANVNGWVYGTVVVDANGNATVTCGGSSFGCGSSLSTVLTIAATGVVSQTGNPDFHAVMSQDKSMLVGKTSSNSGVNGYDLLIVQKAGGTFSQSDLTGTWNVHQLWTGDPPGNWNGWGYGPLVIDGSGNGILYCGASSYSNCSQSSAIATIDTTGVVSVAGGPNFHLMMSQDKSMVIGIDGGTNWFSMIIMMK